MLTLLGTLFGGLFRLAPEVLKFMDKKNERQHELDMLDKQIEADKLKAQAAQQLAETQGATALGLADVQAIVAATQAQATQTGIKWVDGASALVRPLLTYWWCVILYTAALAAEMYALIFVTKLPAYQAILSVWGEDEKAIVSSIISFWFVDRALRKRK